MKYFVTLGDRTIEVDLSGPTPLVDGTEVDAEITGVTGTPLRSLLANGRSRSLVARPGERRGQWKIAVGAANFEVEAIDERTRTIREMTGGADVDTVKVVKAPMPGLVVRIEVAEGDEVSEGQGVAIVEAMKMENELKAPASGVVTSIKVEPGATVNKGDTLIELE